MLLATLLPAAWPPMPSAMMSNVCTGLAIIGFAELVDHVSIFLIVPRTINLIDAVSNSTLMDVR